VHLCKEVIVSIIFHIIFASLHCQCRAIVDYSIELKRMASTLLLLLLLCIVVDVVDDDEK